MIAVAAACDVLRDDTGLIAAIVMGQAAANLRGFDIPARRPFLETLVQLIIGLLFISYLGHGHPRVAPSSDPADGGPLPPFSSWWPVRSSPGRQRCRPT